MCKGARAPCASSSPVNLTSPHSLHHTPFLALFIMSVYGRAHTHGLVDAKVRLRNTRTRLLMTALRLPTLPMTTGTLILIMWYARIIYHYYLHLLTRSICQNDVGEKGQRWGMCEVKWLFLHFSRATPAQVLSWSNPRRMWWSNLSLNSPSKSNNKTCKLAWTSTTTSMFCFCETWFRVHLHLMCALWCSFVVFVVAHFFTLGKLCTVVTKKNNRSQIKFARLHVFRSFSSFLHSLLL